MSPEAISQETDLTVLRQVAIQQVYEIERLQAELTRLEARLAELDPAELQLAKEMLADYKRRLYGRSSERRIPPDKPGKEKKPHRGHGNREQPELAEQTETHTAPPDERVCPHCDGLLEPMGDEAEEAPLIDVIARQFVKVLHRRLKYRCRGCHNYVLTAPGPLKLTPGGLYSPGFAVEVALGKYQFHLPLRRQVQAMKQDGLRTDAQTLWDQLNLLATAVQPSYEAILAEILKQPRILADETDWLLLSNNQVQPSKKWCAWCLVSDELVGYRILDDHSSAAARVVLKDYQGAVLTDGNPVYEKLVQTTPEQAARFVLAHCWAHVRRKFVEAEPHYPVAAEVREMLRELFAIETELAPLTPAERLHQRQLRSRPIVERLFAWAQAQHPLPRSSLGKAIHYMQHLKPGLCRFLENGLIPLSNNACERAQRGLVLGRKNHYGSRSRRGTEVAAIFYTLIESAKLADVDVRDYLLALTERALREPGAVLLPAAFKQSKIE